MTKRLALVPLLLGTLILTACPPIQETARDGVATAKGYLDAAKAHHPECSTPQVNVGVCDLLSRATGAKDAVIDAVNVYCTSPSYDQTGGVCVPNKSAKPKLDAALRDLNQILADVKKIGGK